MAAQVSLMPFDEGGQRAKRVHLVPPLVIPRLMLMCARQRHTMAWYQAVINKGVSPVPVTRPLSWWTPPAPVR